MKKIIFLILCFTAVFSLFVIPSFADANEGYFASGGEYTFKAVLDDSFIPSSPQSFTFTSRNVSFNRMEFQYRGYLLLYYDGTLVYDDSGWTDDSYRTIEFTDGYSIPYEMRTFFLLNEEPNSMYDNIFYVVRDAVYGSRSLTESEDIVVTLIATVLSVLVVALPIVVIYMLLKFFVGTIARY